MMAAAGDIRAMMDTLAEWTREVTRAQDRLAFTLAAVSLLWSSEYDQRQAGMHHLNNLPGFKNRCEQLVDYYKEISNV